MKIRQSNWWISKSFREKINEKFLKGGKVQEFLDRLQVVGVKGIENLLLEDFSTTSSQNHLFMPSRRDHVTEKALFSFKTAHFPSGWRKFKYFWLFVVDYLVYVFFLPRDFTFLHKWVVNILFIPHFHLLFLLLLTLPVVTIWISYTLHLSSSFASVYIKRASSSSFTRWTQIAFKSISFESWEDE